MANYDIPQYPTKRLRYFNNQFLIDQDFIDDDAAQIGHERAFLRSLCVAGVCEGLQVTYPAANLPPSVSPGVAIDKTGRMIVADQATSALAKPDALADGDYFVHISFLETEDAKAAGQGASDFTRWKQTPVINATAKSAALPDGAVVLGSCTVKASQFVGTGTTVGRQYSGLRLPGPNQNAAATLHNTGAADDLAVLGGSLSVAKDVAVAGVVSWSGGGSRTEVRSDAGLRGDAGARSGFFETSSPTNFPKGATSWWHLLDVRHSNTANNFALQIAGSFYDQNLWFRKTNNDATTSWRQIVTMDDSSNASISGKLTLGSIDTSLTIRGDMKDALGPTLKLLNGSAPSTAGGAGGAIDFNGYDPGTNDPTLRIRSIDDGSSSSHLTFATKTPGANTNTLVERLRLTSDGLLQFPNDVKDKIVLWDNGTRRFGIGINSGNLNLFYPADNRFSLRQNSSTGTEVFSVSGSGTVTVQDGNLTASGVIAAQGWALTAKGAKNNQCYFGADATDKGVIIGSQNDTDVTLYSGNNGFMHLVCRDVRAPSDARLKDNIEPIVGALARVVRLSAVSFDWKANARKEGAPKQLGLVAQQVREVVPEAVVDSKEGPLSITYNAITALLVEAVKEQQKHIDELRAALTPAPVC